MTGSAEPRPFSQVPASGISILERREIEARIVGPLIRAICEELGSENALALVRGLIYRLGIEAGAELAKDLGEASLDAFAKGLERWRRSGALEIEVTEHTADRYSFNVTRCRYAEMYQALGMQDLGGALSCQRDHALIEGFNPNIKLTRTQTIMEGKPFCDFRFTVAAPPTAGNEKKA
jgi:L-2-amino-thiazoline-4-carboxylic acid hydrolase-like protein